MEASFSFNRFSGESSPNSALISDNIIAVGIVNVNQDKIDIQSLRHKEASN